MHAWLADLAHGRGSQACARLSARGRDDFLAGSSLGPTGDCEQLIEKSAVLTPTQKKFMPRVVIRRVEIRGDRALVHARDVTIPPQLRDSSRFGRLATAPAGRWRTASARSTAPLPLLVLPHCDSAVAQLRPSRRAAPNRPPEQRTDARSGAPRQLLPEKQESHLARLLVVLSGRLRLVERHARLAKRRPRTRSAARREPVACGAAGTT